MRIPFKHVSRQKCVYALGRVLSGQCGCFWADGSVWLDIAGLNWVIRISSLSTGIPSTVSSSDSTNMASRSAGPESIPAWAIAVLVLVGLLLLVCASCVGLFGWHLMRKRREEKYGKSTMEHWQMRKSLPPNSGSGSGSGEPKGGKKTPRGTTPVLPHDRIPVDVGSKKTASGLMAGKFSASGKVVSDADNSKKSDSMDSRKGKKSTITAGRSTIGAASASSSSGGPPSRETPPTEKSAKGKKKPKKMSDSGSSESVSSSRKSMPSTPNVTMPTPSPSVGPARMSVSVKTAKSVSIASKA